MDNLKPFAKYENQLERLVHTARIFSEDINIESGLWNCALLAIKKEEVLQGEGIVILNGEVMKSIEKKTGYKYLRIFRSRWNQTCKNEGFNT